MKKHIAGLTDYIGKDTILCIDRKPMDPFKLEGFVVGMSKRLLLIHTLVDNPFALNGYAAVRLSDIRSYHVDRSFRPCALRLLDQKPVALPDSDLADWPSLLAWVQDRYPLVWIECEKKRPGCGYVGRIARQTARYCQLNEINTKGQWTGNKNKFAFKEITKVEFDTGYVKALKLLVEHRKSIIETVLQPLIREPLTYMFRTPGYQCFEFGVQRPGKNRRGEDITKSDWGLDVGCNWRITGPQGYIVSSDDFGPRRKRRDKKARPFYEMLRSDPPVVEALKADEKGGFRLGMTGGYMLEVIAEETGEKYDQWWFLPLDKKEMGSVYFTGREVKFVSREDSR